MNEAIPLKERTLEEYAKEKGKTIEEIFKDLPVKVISYENGATPDKHNKTIREKRQETPKETGRTSRSEH